MRTRVTFVMIAGLLLSPVGQWHGTASEFQGPYIGTATARIALALNEDGTWTERWQEGSRAVADSGRWRISGDNVVLESSSPTRPRLTLQHSHDALFAVAVEPLLSGRTTTMALELHQAGRSADGDRVATRAGSAASQGQVKEVPQR